MYYLINIRKEEVILVRLRKEGSYGDFCVFSYVKPTKSRKLIKT